MCKRICFICMHNNSDVHGFSITLVQGQVALRLLEVGAGPLLDGVARGVSRLEEVTIAGVRHVIGSCRSMSAWPVRLLVESEASGAWTLELEERGLVDAAGWEVTHLNVLDRLAAEYPIAGAVSDQTDLALLRGSGVGSIPEDE